MFLQANVTLWLCLKKKHFEGKDTIPLECTFSVIIQTFYHLHQI